MQDRYIKIREVIGIVAKSRPSIYTAMAKGEFPKQYHIGEKSVAWKLSEVNEWVKSRLHSQ